MPDNVGQAAFSFALRSAVRAIAELIWPPKLLGDSDERAPVNADPVIVIHGITDSGRGSQDIAQSLLRDGFRVFAPTMPHSGLDGVAVNAEYLRKYVAWVLQVTGAKKVDFVTHSQGGLSALAFIRAGGESVVDSVTALAAPFHGVAGPWQPILDIFKGVGLLRWLAPKGLLELDERSETIRELMSGDPTPGEILYTSIYSQDADFIVIPGSSSRLEGANNIVMTTKGWLGNRGRDHLSVNHADEVYEMVRRALLASRHG